MTRHRLSHAMLMVPSVQKTVDFWKERHNGIVTRSSQNEDGTLKGAFVVLGTGSDNVEDDGLSRRPSASFALEITTSKQKNNWKLGSSIGYIGVSRLAMMTTDNTYTSSEQQQQQEKDPNGIPVRRVASAPGDPLARFCLRTQQSASLEDVQEFYTNVLGMSAKAVDDRELCLRFDNNDDDDDDISLMGVPTTLVFEAAANPEDNDTEEAGNCLDHIVIESDDIERDYERIQKNHPDGVPMFMKLTEMFGTKLFGVRDPSGYKVILAGKIPSA